MSIATLADYIAAKKQNIRIERTTAVIVAANLFYSQFSGVVGLANKTPGAIPTDADAVADAVIDRIDDFVSGGKGYLTKSTSQVTSNTVPDTLNILFDRIWNGGSYNFNETFPFSINSGSYASRVPGGTDYTNTELWFEAATAFTGAPTITVTYVNEAGATGRSTGAVAISTVPTARRAVRLPLQAGDTGISAITDVTCSGATAGTFNLLVLRRLVMQYHSCRHYAGRPTIHDLLDLGMPEVLRGSCLMVMQTANGVTGGPACFEAEIASG